MPEQFADSSEEPRHRRSTEAAERAKTRAVEVWSAISKALTKPAIGAGVAGATVLAAGAMWGVTEAAFAGVAAWAVFRSLRKRASHEAPTTKRPTEVMG